MEAKKEIVVVVNKTFEETKVAVLENGRLFDLFIERKESGKILNNIYKGKVQNVVPALDSAFVDIGFGKSAYLGICDTISRGSEKKIGDIVKAGENIIVQVYKEPISKKGPKVTMDISLPGRLLVYMPFSGGIGVSRRIKSKQESERLRDIIVRLKKNVSGGIIVRTEAENAAETEIKNEVKYLTKLWTSIVKKFKNAKPASLVHKDLGIVFQTIRDYFSSDVALMHIDSQKELDNVVNFVKVALPEFLDKIVLYDSKVPIFKAYGIKGEINKLRSNKADLASGGYIIVQEAESLCAVDVNSGKFTSKLSQEETAVLTNLEASEEIARQLRLRNIGGIIVIDFIDMRKAANKRKVLNGLRKATSGDKARIKIWPITKLGLVEMTRERTKESLFSLLGDTCPLCRGLGLVLSKDSIFINVCDEIEHSEFRGCKNRIKIKLNPDIADYFEERKSRLKRLFNTDFDIEADPEILREEYKIIF